LFPREAEGKIIDEQSSIEESVKNIHILEDTVQQLKSELNEIKAHCKPQPRKKRKVARKA
jgi:hypothetical protein